MRLIQILIILFLIPFASAIEWQSACSITVYNHQNITCNGYNLTNIQFSSPVKTHNYNGKLVLDSVVIPAVTFQLEKNSRLIETVLLDTSTTTYTNNTEPIQITAGAFTPIDSLLWIYEQYNPKATLSINFVKLPTIQVRISPEYQKYEYNKATQIKTTIEVWNSGDIAVSDISLDYDFAGLETHNTLTKKIATLTKKEGQSYTYYLDIPQNNSAHTYTLKANASIKIDVGATQQTFTFRDSNTTAIIPASQNILFTKYIPDRLYVGDNATVVITISNSGIYDLYDVVITDSVTDSMLAYQPLKFTIPFLKHGSQETFSYLITPVKAGRYTVSSAIMNYSIAGLDYTIKTNEISLAIIETGKKVIIPTPTPIITTPQPIITIASTPQATLPASNTFNTSNPLPESKSKKPSKGFVVIVIIGLAVGFVILIKK